MTEQAAPLDRIVSTGVARKVDDLGRIVLPVELRRVFNIRPGDALQIAVDGGDILLRKVEARCVFCNGDEALGPYRGKQVCAPCADALRAQRGAQPHGDVVDPPLGDVKLGGHGR